MLVELTLRDFLSFDDKAPSIPLGPLNVLVGANGSGKSNLIEAIGLLAEAPRKDGLAGALRRGGGIREWFWKGRGKHAHASIEAVVKLPDTKDPPIRHRLELAESGQQLLIWDERVENAAPSPGHKKPYFYFGYENSVPMINAMGVERGLTRDSVNAIDSILAQRRDPDTYPVLTRLAEQYEQVRIYRDWTFGRSAPNRRPEATDLPSDFLLPDASNLAMVLNALKKQPKTRRRIEEYLDQLAERFEHYETTVEGGSIQLFLQEGDWLVPAVRLSDGTLRFITLLAVLLHPKPPPLVVIEEPELGLHPDMMPTIAELLLDASQRTQVVTTTHSDILIDALTEHPEAILVCDKDGGGTQVRRLDAEELRPWLEDYSLGRLWRSGELGGNRW
jgi:predicted ATPase